MKKSLLAVIISAFILITKVIWISDTLPLSLREYIQFVIIGIFVCFGFYVGYRRFTSEKCAQPADDEFSKNVLQQSAAISYYISLYPWLIIMYLTDRLKIETESMFGWGILGMAVIIAGSWIYLNLRGMKEA